MPARKSTARTTKKAVRARPAKPSAKTRPSTRVAAAGVRRAGKAAKKPAKRPTSQYADIRRDLERQRATLLQEAGVPLTNRAEFEMFPDLTDQASATMDQNFVLRLRDRERKLLKKISEAIDRIDSRTYGICESCEAVIPYKRLKARPVTTLCIDCKTQQEHDEHIRA